MSTLLLHAGAEAVVYDDLKSVPIPAPTETHVPIPHHQIVELVKYTLGYYHHEVVDEHYGVTPDGLRFFGLLSLRSAYGDYEDTVGLRNSNDRRFPISISFGSRIFVCDNLAFVGDHVIRRKHTAKAWRDLPGLLAEVEEPLREQRLEQAQRFEMYQRTRLLARHVDHCIMQLYRRGIINVQRIDDVLDAYERPPHDWGAETAYRLFNATTFALTGRVMEAPATTARLHAYMDDFCEAVYWEGVRAPVQQLALPAPLN